MLRKTLLLAAATGAALCVSAPASAAGFLNGSFEDNSCGVAPGAFGTIFPANSCITAWTVGPHSVDLIRETYWDAHDGEYSLYLAGNAPGSISQIFDTVVGADYFVEYWLSGNPEGGDFWKDGVVKAVINGTNVYASSFSGGQGADNDAMNWRRQFFSFTATGNQTTLSFASGADEGAFGPALDAVSVTGPVPEPATWAMMLLGFGLVGFGLRRRNAVQGQSRLRVAYS